MTRQTPTDGPTSPNPTSGYIKARGVDFRQRLHLGRAIAWHLLTHPREFFLSPRQ